MAIEILYEDNHLLIVNKPAGILTQPSGTQQDNLLDRCKVWIKEKYQKPGAVFLEAVHRLDKPVSGIVVFARTSKALSRLNLQSRSKQWKKLYQAIVEPAPAIPADTLKHFILHGEQRAEIVDANNPLGKEAILHYRMLQQNGSQALLEIQIETGRYHQIRAQLAAIGSPIVGDIKYGGISNSKSSLGIELHHHYLKLYHPISGQMMEIQSHQMFHLT